MWPRNSAPNSVASLLFRVYAVIRVCKRRKRMPQKKQREEGYNPWDTRLVLTSEDLAEALQEV